MSAITILREPDAEGNRVQDVVDESLLVRTDGQFEDDNELTKWVEYRFPGSDVVVHRSVHVHMKKWPPGFIAGQQQGFGG